MRISRHGTRGTVTIDHALEHRLHARDHRVAAESTLSHRARGAPHPLCERRIIQQPANRRRKPVWTSWRTEQRVFLSGPGFDNPPTGVVTTGNAQSMACTTACGTPSLAYD